MEAIFFNQCFFQDRFLQVRFLPTGFDATGILLQTLPSLASLDPPGGRVTLLSLRESLPERQERGGTYVNLLRYMK